MRVSRTLRGRWRISPRAILLALAALSSTPARPAAAQAGAMRTRAAVDYIVSHSDREDMVRVPMRDSINLSATILFPKDKPRQNLPTVLIFIPYLTENTIRGGLF